MLALAAILALGPDPSALVGPPVPPETVTSGWGGPSEGLRIRLTMPKRLAVGKPLEYRVDLAADPATRPARVELLNRAQLFEQVELVFTPVGPEAESGAETSEAVQRFSLRWRDWSDMPMFDREIPQTVALDGGAIEPISPTIVTAAYDDVIKPGEYSVKAKLAVRPITRAEWPFPGREYPKEFEKCWRGTATSAAVTMTFDPIEVTKVVFWAPKRLRVLEGGVGYTKDDATPMDVELREGYVTGTSYWFASGAGGMSGGLIEPGVLPNFSQLVDRSVNSCRFSVFTTNRPAGHFWDPAEGSGYRVIWTADVPIEHPGPIPTSPP